MKITRNSATENEDQRPLIPSPVTPTGFTPDADQPTRNLANSTAFTQTQKLPEFDKPQSNHSGVKWQRIQFPSNSVAYPAEYKNGIKVRAMDIATLALVHEAQQHKSQSALYDAMQHCIEMDIRNLTIPDFYFMIYWLRLTSYPRTPFVLQWTSRYGNSLSTTVTMSTLDIVYLKMTPDEYNMWKLKGLTFPTMRDQEFIAEGEFTLATKWMRDYSQYIYLPEPAQDPTEYTQQKIARFQEMGVDAMQDISDFASKINHGVVEEIPVKDDRFDLPKAIDFVSAEIESLTNMVENALALDSTDGASTEGLSQYIAIGQHIDNRTAELKNMQQALAAGTLYHPEQEVVALQVEDPTFLFP